MVSKLVPPATARYLDLTERRERAQKLELASAEMAAQRARDLRDDALRRQSEDEAGARAAVANPVSAALLAFTSSGLAVGAQSVASEDAAVVEAEIPVAAAQEGLSIAARDRLVAERWAERQRVARVQEIERKLDREASDRFGRG